MPKLIRMSDGKGDSGPRSQAISWNDNGTFKEVVDNKPTIGCSLLVGSLSARTYAEQDYWLTTPVTEIIEERDDYVKFKTGNSIYEWFL